VKSISIRNVPDDVYDTLQQMARQSRRSLQEQVKVILEQETRLANRSFLNRAAEWRKRFQGRNLSDTVEAIREDRRR
jgi:plasmid stability protein